MTKLPCRRSGSRHDHAAPLPHRRGGRAARACPPAPALLRGARPGRASGRSPGGSRRYAETDLERVLHIRELQAMLGFNLEEIHEIVGAEDRLAELDGVPQGVTPRRQARSWSRPPG